MNRLFSKVVVIPVLPFSHIIPGRAARTFVAAAGMSSGGTMSAPTTPSAPSTPPTTMQQVLEIFGQPITGEAPKPPETFAQYPSAREAAKALQETRRLQYQSLIGSLGGPGRAAKEEVQAVTMRKEADIIRQLERFGIPRRAIPQFR